MIGQITTPEPLVRIKEIWKKLYPNTKINQQLLDRYLDFLADYQKRFPQSPSPANPLWYKEARIYALYVDQFAKDFSGLIKRLDHLEKLGCNTLWLLPLLESPGLDQGYDVTNFEKVRDELGGNQGFLKLVVELQKREMHLIFDLPINHTSNQHPWFQKARVDKEGFYHHFYIWADKRENLAYYQDAFGQKLPVSVVFPHDPAHSDLDSSDPRQNWVWDEVAGEYYYRTFYRHQPDLNYRNPEVLFEMAKVFAFWSVKGVGGFRVDATVHLWKEEGTSQENLPQTHLILQFFQATVEFLQPTTIFIAEAYQPLEKLLVYLRPEECRLAYDFPRMIWLWHALITENSQTLAAYLKKNPALNAPCQWVGLLRAHDELLLEGAPDKEREIIYKQLIKKGLDFKKGRGVSGRLASFLNSDPKKILLAWALLLVQPVSPVIFQGDAEGAENNYDYYQAMKEATGENDTRFVNRGPMDWPRIDRELQEANTLTHKVYLGLQKMLKIWREYNFGKARLELLKTNQKQIFACIREYQDKRAICLHNLGKTPVLTSTPLSDLPDCELLGQKVQQQQGKVFLPGYSFLWIGA